MANTKEIELLSEIEKLKKERDFWKDAWFDQRRATGKNWWEGYRKGLTDTDK